MFSPIPLEIPMFPGIFWLFNLAERKPRDGAGDTPGNPQGIGSSLGLIPPRISLENVTRRKRDGAGIA